MTGEEARDELTRRARRALEHAEELAPKIGVRRFDERWRLWQYSSFSPWHSWTLFLLWEGNDLHRAVAREVFWNMPADCHRLSDPLEGVRAGFHSQPTLSVRDVELSTSEVVSQIEAGRRIAVPLVSFRGGMGLDGTSWGLGIQEGLRALRLEWWENGPDAWAEATRWAGELRLFLQTAFDRQATL